MGRYLGLIPIRLGRFWTMGIFESDCYWRAISGENAAFFLFVYIWQKKGRPDTFLSFCSNQTFELVSYVMHYEFIWLLVLEKESQRFQTRRSMRSGSQYRQRGILVRLNRQNKWSVACLVTAALARDWEYRCLNDIVRRWLGNSASPSSNKVLSFLKPLVAIIVHF